MWARTFLPWVNILNWHLDCAGLLANVCTRLHSSSSTCLNFLEACSCCPQPLPCAFVALLLINPDPDSEWWHQLRHTDHLNAHTCTHTHTHTHTHLMENCKILGNCKWLGTHAAYKRYSLSKQHNFSRQRPYHAWSGACNSSHGWPEEDNKSYFHLATRTDCWSTGTTRVTFKTKWKQQTLHQLSFKVQKCNVQ